jgi:GTP-binding protein
VDYNGQKIVLVDTAGMRRRGKVEWGIEHYSVLRAVRAIERADVVVLVIDGSEGVTAQDTHLAGFAVSEAKGVCLVVNKWDLLPRSPQVADEFTAQVREDFKFAPFAPLRFVSARTRWHVDEVMKTVIQIGEQRKRRIPTATFNDLISEAVDAHGPSSERGRALKILYATQVAINPPTFVFFVNDASLLHFSYRRYLENRIRQAFGFEGTAIKLIFRSREGRQEEFTPGVTRRSSDQARRAGRAK